MPSFKEFLNDEFSTGTRNLHLEHIEDEILNLSYSGANDALRFIESVAGTLAGNSTGVEVTTKWDGSPAIFVGTNPENGKFFVATKGLFNKQPVVNYTAEDVKENHSGDLATKLIVALEELQHLDIQGVLQGDLMFTQSDLRHQLIEEVDYVTFSPNTITYAVPANSPQGEKITNSALGIIFHTSYIGETLDSLSASYAVDISILKSSDTVWFDDATHLDESVSLTFDANELYLLRKHAENAERLLDDLNESELDEIIDHPDIVKMIKMYTNKNIIDGVGNALESDIVVNGLIEYIHDRLEREKEVLKTESAKDRRDKKKQQLEEFIESNRRTLEMVFEFQKNIVFAKKVLLRKLSEASKISTFLEGDQGYSATAPEGFVVVNHHTNRAVKLVNRLEFSRANFRRNIK